MKFLIAGLGSIGRRHLHNLLALGERDILLYRTHTSTLPEEELNEFPVETDLEAALAHQPDGVIIANPTALHLEVAIPAAYAGCHILLEKPISHNQSRVAEFKDALQQGGGQVLVGFHYRFHPGLRQVARLLAASEIGRPLSVRCHWGEYLPGWHPWEDYRLGYSARKDLGGGVVLTLSHPLDYMRWLLGEIDALWSFIGQSGDLDLSVEDTAEIGLRFRDGILGSLHLNYNQQPARHDLEIVGTHGTIRWDNQDGTVQVYRTTTNTWEEIPAPAGFRRNWVFLDEMRHFLAVMRGESQPACTLADGERALELALAAHRSSERGQVVFLGSPSV